MISNESFNMAYYAIKPFIPRWVQIWLRSKVVRAKRRGNSKCWPILETAGLCPAGWPGWPQEKKVGVILTHDVETMKGVENCWKVAELEMEQGFRSSFNFVVKRSNVPDSLRRDLLGNGFEVGVHGVYHDGKLFQTQKIFDDRAKIINDTLRTWEAVGFRAPAMHHKLEWLHELNILYDLSTFDHDPFEPQSDGVNTIFPFFVRDNGDEGGYVELPYTLAQDFTLFILLKEKSIQLWQQKMDWIKEKGGMALLNTHPDYMIFNGDKERLDGYSSELYQGFLKYINVAYEGLYWHGLPKDLAEYYLAEREKAL